MEAVNWYSQVVGQDYDLIDEIQFYTCNTSLDNLNSFNIYLSKISDIST